MRIDREMLLVVVEGVEAELLVGQADPEHVEAILRSC